MVIDVSKNKGMLVGSFKLNESINEISVEASSNYPNIRKRVSCDVRVYGDEGMNPHLHIYGNGETCISLITNKYFSHKDSHIQFENSKQKKDFDEWCRKSNIKIAKDKHMPGITNYQACILLWNDQNPHAIMDANHPQPDYSTLSGELKKNR